MSKRSTSKQPDEPTFFIDRDLGSHPETVFGRILTASGMSVHFHDSYFPSPEEPALDHEWAELCAANNWIALTKDKATNRSDLFVDTVMVSGATVFVHIGEWPHDQIAQNVINSRHKLARFAHKHRRGALIGRLYMPNADRFERGTGGDVSAIRTQAQWNLDRVALQLENSGREASWEKDDASGDWCFWIDGEQVASATSPDVLDRRLSDWLATRTI